mgnify:FL=1
MVLNDNVYKVLKWLGLIVLPAIATLVKAVFPVWELPYADAIAITCTAVGTFIGTIICVSSANLKSEMAEQAVYVLDTDAKEETAETNEEAKG